MTQAELEQALIKRGNRILYRRPDDIDVWTYQLEHDGEQWGFRITEKVIFDSAWGADKVVDYIMRSIK